MQRLWAAGAYDRKSSVTNRSGAKAYKLTHQFQSVVFVALGLNQHIENLALSVDGATDKPSAHIWR